MGGWIGLKLATKRSRPRATHDQVTAAACSARLATTADQAARLKGIAMDKIKEVRPLPSGCVFVEFASGRKGEFDVTPYMGSSFFSQLKDPDYFAKVGVFFSGIGWPEGQDLGPDTIAAELRAVAVAP